jgi:rsbT co-antagonist protein RsbR
MKLTDKFKITDAERRQRLVFLHLGSEDFRLLAGLRDTVEPHIPIVVEEFYSDLLRYAEVRRFFAANVAIDIVKAAQRAYLLTLFQGEPDENYFEQRLRIGEVHERLGVPLKWYIASMGQFYERLVKVLRAAGPANAEGQLAAALALNKVMNLDLQLALESYASLSLRMRMLDQRIKETAAALNAAIDPANR